MTIRHMKIFVTVYQTGNITRAAEKLYMTQPVVSRAIQELERYYGVPLFERINQRIFVTEAGKQLYSYALHIIDVFGQMENELRGWNEFGVIRVGATPTWGTVLLPKVLKAYQTIYPGITLKTVVVNETRLQEMLGNNELDMALIEGSVTAENLVTEELTEDRLVLLMSIESELLQREKIVLADLQNYPMLLREKGSANRTLIDQIFELHGFSVNPMMESVSVHAIVQGVHEGLGISFLPERLVRYSIESRFVATRLISDEMFIRKNYIVWHKNKLLNASVKEFIQLCRLMADQMDK